MADTPEEHEKTEDPSEQKLKKAREQGDVPKSQEVTTWFMLMAATLAVLIFSSPMASSLAGILKYFLEMSHDIRAEGETLRLLMWTLGLSVVGAAGLPFLLLWLAGILGNLLQNPPLISAEPIKPKLSKISPNAGFKRLLSVTSLVNFAKSIAKLTIVGAVIVIILWPERDVLDIVITMDPAALLGLTKTMTLKVLGGVVAVFTVLAGLDLVYQRHTWWKKQRMTIKEVRDEHKDMEGDPQVRAKIRQIRVERGRKRMMANVPDAALVITNPTHYSIALKYEDGMSAPVCVAKGVDALALKIREIAEEHDIPLVENPALARALYAGVEVEEEIPTDHYQAVAEVIGFVMRLRRQ